MAYILTDKPKRTAGNAWLERVNPLHGLTIAQARDIFDVARAHGSPLLQKIYDEIELVDPVLGVCVDRRQAALAELGWKISPRPSADQVLAYEQKDALDAFDAAVETAATRLVVVKMDLGMKADAFDKAMADAVAKLLK